MAHVGDLPACPDSAQVVSRGSRARPTGNAEPAGGARLGRRGAEPRGPCVLLRQLRGGPRRPILLRAVPGGVRSGTPQGPGRLVYAHRSGQVHGRPRRCRTAEYPGRGGRAGRPERLHPRSLLRDRRLSGGGAAEDRRDAEREGRRCACRPRSEGGGARPGVRLRDPARALRGGAPPVGTLAPVPRRSTVRKQAGARPRVPDERAYWLGAGEAPEAARLSRNGGGARGGRNA